MVESGEVRTQKPGAERGSVSGCLGGRNLIRGLGWAAVVGTMLFGLARCVGAGRVEPTRPAARLAPVATVELGSSAAAACADGETLLVLENSGTRVVRYTLSLSVLDTIPLADRVTAPAGITADRFYIYVYDNHILYRMAKDKLSLVTWLNNVRTTGLAGFEPGMMLVSDADRGAIWYKGLFGESRKFLSAADVARPGAMVALPDGSFAVISTASRLLCYFNRSGVVTRRASLPADCDLLAANAQGALGLGLRGKPQVWVLKAGKTTGYGLPDSTSPSSIALVGDRLVVLDAGTRLAVYPIGD